MMEMETQVSSLGEVLNFKGWIEENRHLLKPPVGNKMLWRNREFIVMVVGGPNQRTDYHINQSEELFYQVYGDIELKVREKGKFRSLKIREGEMYLLPARVPHSPQRPANTVGLVVERSRREGENDIFLWYCDGCGGVLYSESFFLTDIETQVKGVLSRYHSDPLKSICEKCGKRAC